MRLVLIVLSFFLFSETLYSVVTDSVEKKDCKENSIYRECFIRYKSADLKGLVYLNIIGPKALPWKELPLVVFLHGRSGNVPYGGQSQIMNLGLKKYMQTGAFKGAPFVVVAPQDNFQHGDKLGQDYWVGALESHRNWGKFLAFSLIEFMKSEFQVGRGKCKRIISGISMGAHGALLVGMNFPNKFVGVGAHSPIFRSQIFDVKDYDEDVFGSAESKEVFQKRSVGYRLVYKKEKLPFSVFIDIGKNDRLLIDEYKSGVKVWEHLEGAKLAENSFVRRRSALNHSSGHGFRYWKSMYKHFYFDWYQSVFQKSCRKSLILKK